MLILLKINVFKTWHRVEFWWHKNQPGKNMIRLERVARNLQ